MDTAKQSNARAIKSGVVLQFIQRSGCAGLCWTRLGSCEIHTMDPNSVSKRSAGWKIRILNALLPSVRILKLNDFIRTLQNVY